MIGTCGLTQALLTQFLRDNVVSLYAQGKAKDIILPYTIFDYSNERVIQISQYLPAKEKVTKF